MNSTMMRALASGVLAVIVAAATLPAATGGGSSAEETLDPEEQKFVQMINQYRQQNGVAPLSIDTSLQQAAEWMSRDMGENNYFSHTDSLGRDPFVRMCDFGYCYNTWKGENLAAGASSAESVFNLWKDSPGHNSNMLNGNYRVMGIARVHTPDSNFGWYWTNDFGGYVASSSPPPSEPTPTPSPTGGPTPPPTPTASPAPTPTPRATADPAPSAKATPTLRPSEAPRATATPTVAPPPSPTTSPTPSSPSQPRGDVDCDGQITVGDALNVLRLLAGLSAPSCSALTDLNCDGTTDLEDALVILRYVAALTLHLPSNCPSVGSI
jgi:uncharacterized protein YkwD